ncbi:Ribosomal large subunit pseudouridine synthase C [compost metagenome]
MIFKILFEDEYFLAADKPAGLPSQATLDKNRPSFFTALQKQLQNERGPDFYLGLHHRLDQGTSGVMIFAKSKAANTPLADLFKKHQIQKTYIAISKKFRCSPQWQSKNFLDEAPRTNKERARMIPVKSGGQLAITDFRMLEDLPQGIIIEAKPLTGRMHQIRAHLSERGLGIFGDDLYASAKTPVAPRLMLHAHRLEFRHPFTGEDMKIESPLPEDMLLFKAKLSTDIDLK